MRQFLVSNDDGIAADGIKALVKALMPLGKVYVTAPAQQQSVKSGALSIRKTLTVQETSLEGAERAWVIDGTPADCVKFGIQILEGEGIVPDFVLSGINMGANLGTDVHYSGTIACAKEGAMSGIRSIALSITSHEAKHFKYLCSMLPELLDLSMEFGADTFLNVNSPDEPVWKIQGVRMVPAGGRSYHTKFVEDPAAEEDVRIWHYEGGGNEHYPAGTDLEAIREGYVTVTPMSILPTDWNALQKMRRVTDSKTVCVLVDYQEKLMPAIRKSGKVLGNAVRFARCAERLDFPVIVTQQYTRGLGPTVPELRQALHHYDKIEKLSFSCWDAPGFADRIAASIHRSVVIAGVESHICVQQTALDFLKRGYEVTVLRDCCGSRNKEDHEAAMALLAQAGCTVTTWEAYVYQVLGTSTNTAFKAISAIVREDRE